MSNNTMPDNNPMFVPLNEQLKLSGTNHLQVGSISQLEAQAKTFMHPHFIQALIKTSDALSIEDSPITLVEAKADSSSSAAVIDLAKFYDNPLLTDFISIIYIEPSEDSPGKLGNTSISHAIRMHQRSAMVAANILRDKDPEIYDDYLKKSAAKNKYDTIGNIYYIMIREYLFAPNGFNAIRTKLTSLLSTASHSGNAIENQLSLVAQLTGLNQSSEIFSRFPEDRVFINILVSTMKKLGTDWIKEIPNYTGHKLSLEDQIEGGLKILNQLVTNREG